MKTITAFLSAGLLAATVVTASAEVIPLTQPAQESHEEKGSRPVVIVLHQQNDGAKVTIPNGALVKVVLETQAASTGFDWAPEFSTTVLIFKNKSLRHAAPHLVGAPSRECWFFKAVAPGQTDLTFSLSRPWEKNVPATQSVHFNITVE